MKYGNLNFLEPSGPFHPASCKMGTGSFPGVSCGRGVTLTPHPLLVPRSKIEQSYTSTFRKDLRGLWKGETYLPCSAMVPMVARKALLHDWSSSTAKSCVLWPLKTAMKRKVTVWRIQDTTKNAHTGTEKGCSRASGIAVVAGCRNVRGHLYRQSLSGTPLPHPTRYELDGTRFEPRQGGGYFLYTGPNLRPTQPYVN